MPIDTTCIQSNYLFTSSRLGRRVRDSLRLTGITAYVPYCEFPFERLEDITSRIGEFSVRLQKLHNYKGYLIVYSARDKKIARVTSFANKARGYLIDELEIDPKAIEAVNGGYRDQSTVELFLIPSDWPPPVPTPTIDGFLK